MPLIKVTKAEINILNSTTRLIQLKVLKDDYVTYDWFNRRLLTVRKTDVLYGKVDLKTWFIEQVISHTTARIDRVADLRSTLKAYQIMDVSVNNPYAPHTTIRLVRVDVPYYSFSDGNIINGNTLTMTFTHVCAGPRTDKNAVEKDFGFMFNKMIALERHLIELLDRRKGKGGLSSSTIKKVKMIFDTTPAKYFPLVNQSEHVVLVEHLKKML